MKRILHTVLLAATLLGPLLAAACSSASQDARTESLKRRIDRQDNRIEARSDRRRMRAEAEDRRYHDWFNRVMGRPGGF